MATRGSRSTSKGPFRADQIRPGDPYELSDGHPVYCEPTGGHGAQKVKLGAQAILTDPAAQDDSGVDPGYAPRPNVLRSPDIAVGNVPDEPGWIKGVPLLAVEYADTGQDEAELSRKITDLLKSGTKHLWVVRLTGIPRVEVHEPGLPMRIAVLDEELTAPGILKNPVPVRALFEPGVARRVALRNLLQGQGYESLEAVQEQARTEGEAKGKAEGLTEGKAEGLTTGLLMLLEFRGIALTTAERERISSCRNVDDLRRWLDRARVAGTAAAILV